MLLTQKIKSYYATESGRSMIEMLGVLAIIGVLSVGSVAGYKFAVDKYKANETMHELFQRAIVYSTQMLEQDFASGTVLNNGEFGNKTSLGYPVEAKASEYEDEFNVSVGSVPSDVCVQLLKNLTYADVIRGISVGGSVYDFDTEDTSICGDDTNKEVVLAFASQLDWENVEVSGNGNDQEMTTLPPKQAGDPCSSNADCQPSEGLYCKYDNGGSCTVAPTNGVCKSVGSATPVTVAGVGQYIKSSSYMTWWSAQNYCLAVGGTMPTVSDFGCGYDFVGKRDSWGYCNAADNDASGQTLSDNMKAFKSAFGSDYVWTSDLYTPNTCRAYRAPLGSGYMASATRSNDFYALCRVGD